MSSVGPRVVAVLVTHDGASTVRRAIASVVAQTVPGIEIVAVDNASTDGTAVVLAELLGHERVVVAEQDLGFGAGVDLALDALDALDARHGRGSSPDDLVLLLHDDLELEPDAVERLVEALEDERVAIVGPKLRWADDPRRLQSVGATIDLTGRVDDGLDPGELDQGQRDTDRRVLFVSTAGMMVRRGVLDRLGRFDRRMQAFREDLDLCWRAAIAGHDVEVVPSAVGRHAARAAEHDRGGVVAAIGPRSLAERNTLAALLTNYGPERLLVVLPLALVVGVAKVAGFLLTRRIADARATVGAWAWNLTHLRGTLRRRRVAQGLRRRSDAELAPLFGRIMPRLQAYLEAVLDRLLGDAGTEALSAAEGEPSATLQDEVATPSAPVRRRGPSSLEAEDGARPRTRLRDRIRTRPMQVLLPAVALLLLLGLRDVVLPGTVRGGDLLPFPSGEGLLARHLGTWHDSGASLSALDPSPAQLVLGALQWLAGDAVLRVLMVLVPLLAWTAAVRAMAPHLPNLLLRTLLGLAYAFAPPFLVALRTGDVVTLVVSLALPVLAVSANTILDRHASVERVWRRLALVAFVLATVVAFAPSLVLVLPVLLLAGVGHALVAVEDRGWRRTLLVRTLAVSVLPVPLLGPWLRTLPDVLGEALAGAGGGVGGHPIAWVALDPSGLASGVAGIGLVAAAVAGALVVSVSDVGATGFRATLGLLTLGLGLPLLGWWSDAVGTAVRTGPLLGLATAALVAVVAAGAGRAQEVLARHPFGWRQLVLGTAGSATVVLAAGGLLVLAIGGTPGLAREAAVPPYLATLGPFPPDRVLVLGAREDGVAWEVVPATGPDLAAFGVRHDPDVRDALTVAVDDLLAGSDPRAAERLGRLGVGVVLVPEGFADPVLESRLRSQAVLDPLPSLSGTVARVRGSVPGAALVSDRVSVARVPDPTVPPRTVTAVLERQGPDRFAGDSGDGGDLLAVTPFGSGWRVIVDGDAVPMLSDDGLVRVLDVPAGARVELDGAPSTARRTGLQLQALWALLVISLGARPPAVARRVRPRDVGRAGAGRETSEVGA